MRAECSAASGRHPPGRNGTASRVTAGEAPDIASCSGAKRPELGTAALDLSSSGGYSVSGKVRLGSEQGENDQEQMAGVWNAPAPKLGSGNDPALC